MVPADALAVDVQVKRALDAIFAKYGRLTTVVNCAGIAPPARVLGKKGVHPLSQFQKVHVNCGHFCALHGVFPLSV